jgi:hypothetical protein
VAKLRKSHVTRIQFVEKNELSVDWFEPSDEKVLIPCASNLLLQTNSK